MCFEIERVTCGADFKESAQCSCCKDQELMEVTPLRHVDLYKRRPPENDSHCDLITQTLACFVEYFLKMFSMKELLLEKECLSYIYIYFVSVLSKKTVYAHCIFVGHVHLL